MRSKPSIERLIVARTETLPMEQERVKDICLTNLHSETLTRNFLCFLGLCVMTLVAMPIGIAWISSMILR